MLCVWIMQIGQFWFMLNMQAKINGTDGAMEVCIWLKSTQPWLWSPWYIPSCLSRINVLCNASLWKRRGLIPRVARISARVIRPTKLALIVSTRLCLRQATLGRLVTRAVFTACGVYSVIKLKPSNLSGGTVYLLHPSVSCIEGFVLACGRFQRSFKWCSHSYQSTGIVHVCWSWCRHPR